MQSLSDGVPVGGITTAGALVTDLTRSGQLPHGSITKLELYRCDHTQAGLESGLLGPPAC